MLGTLGTAITLIALVAIALALLLRLEGALPPVLACVLVLPVASFGGAGFRAEHVLMPVVQLAVLLRIGGTRGCGGGAVPLLLGASWLALGLAAAVDSPVTTGGWFLGSYTVVRPLLWIALGLVAWSPTIVPSLVRWWLGSSMVISALVLAQAAQVPIVRAVSDIWYASAGRAAGTLIAEAELQGFFARPMGTFENVAYAATAELLSLGTALWWLTSGPASRLDRALAIGALMLAVAAGFATVSATFIAGAPIVVVVALLLAVRRPSWISVAAVFVTGALVTLGLLWLMDTMWGGAASMAAQVDRVRTITLFANRYSSGNGVMADAIRDIGHRPWFGWGVLAGGDTFFSDSLYVFVAYTTGAVGVALMLLLLVSPWAHARRVSSLAARFAALWAVIMLLAGLGAPTVFVPRLMEWWWAIVGIMAGLNVDRLHSEMPIVDVPRRTVR